jgi:hypothetical protein
MRSLAAAPFVLAALTSAGLARADESIIESPGEHRDYLVEIEPHADLAFFNVGRNVTGYGLGVRASFPIVRQGFLDDINNSVAIGVGADWLSYSGCYNLNFGDCSDITAVWVPAVLQWNFYLSRRWSVFGEPGVTFRHVGYGDNCPDTTVGNEVVRVDCGGGSSNKLLAAFWAGGRYHVTDAVTLTARIGFNYWTVGASFM